MKTLSLKHILNSLKGNESLFEVQSELHKYFLGNHDLSFFGRRELSVKMKQDALEKSVNCLRKEYSLLSGEQQQEYMTFKFVPEVSKKVMSGNAVYGTKLNHSKIDTSPAAIASLLNNSTYSVIKSLCTSLDLRVLYYHLEGEDLNPRMSEHDMITSLLVSVRVWI